MEDDLTKMNMAKAKVLTKGRLSLKPEMTKILVRAKLKAKVSSTTLPMLWTRTDGMCDRSVSSPTLTVGFTFVKRRTS